MAAGTRAAVVAVVFPVLAALCVAARLVARIRILRNPGWEDAIIVVSMMSSVVVSVLICLQVKYGLGKHFHTLDADEFKAVLKYLWASIPFYNLSLSLTKISLVLQYTRVFIDKKFRFACWSVLAFIMSYGIWSVVSAIFNCVPIAAFWDVTIVGRCLDKKFMWFFNASLNLVTDIILVAMPMPVLKNLQLPKKQKIGLMCIFGLGGFVCLVSILRLHSLYVISISTDPTYDNVEAAIWSMIEINVGIICGSLATLRPIISRVFPRAFTSHKTSLPTYNSTVLTNIEAHKGGGSHVRSHSFTPKVSKSGHHQLQDPVRSHTSRKNMVLRKGEAVDSAPDEDVGVYAEKRVGGTRDIVVTTAVRRDIEITDGHRQSLDSDDSLIFRP